MGHFCMSVFCMSDFFKKNGLTFFAFMQGAKVIQKGDIWTLPLENHRTEGEHSVTQIGLGESCWVQLKCST